MQLDWEENPQVEGPVAFVKNNSKLILLMHALLMLLAVSGCGDAGNSNGAIRGTIFANRSGGSLSKTPEPGVSVVAQAEDADPIIIRTSVTDGNGQYVFTNMPIGKYVIGATKDGFETITTEKGSSATQSALGEQTRVFVETGSTVTAPDMTLVSKAPEGDGTVIVNLVDNITGEPVNGATVTVGNASTSNGSNGQYVLSVPVTVNTGDTPGQKFPLTINAEGYTAADKAEVPALAGQTVESTVFMTPKGGNIEGKITFDKFEQLYEYTEVQISVDGIPTSFLGGNAGDCTGGTAPDASGNFQICVPVRTEANNRSYTIRFTHKAFFDVVVNNQLGPLAGSIHIDPPALQPQTVTIVGDVVNPDTSQNAVVQEAGLEGGITGGAALCPQGTRGQYSIDGVPTNTALTIVVNTYTCDEGGVNPPTIGSQNVTFTAVNNGTGVFRAPPISGGGGN